MLRYILLVQLFLTGVFGHGMAADHIHIFNNFHMVDFILLIIGFIGVYILFGKLSKRDN